MQCSSKQREWIETWCRTHEAAQPTYASTCHTFTLAEGTTPDVPRPRPQSRIVCVSAYRILFIKWPRILRASVDTSHHLFDLKLVDPGQQLEDDEHAPVRLHVKAKGKGATDGSHFVVNVLAPMEVVQDLIRGIRVALRRITPGFPPAAVAQFKVPETWLVPVAATNDGNSVSTSQDDSRSLGGYRTLYRAFCAYQDKPVSASFLHFLDDLEQGRHGVARRLVLSDCPGQVPGLPTSLDYGPPLLALFYNSFFRSIVLENVRGQKGLPALLARPVAVSPCLTQLCFHACGAQDWRPLFDGLRRAGTRLQVGHLRITQCTLRVADVLALKPCLLQWPCQLRVLDLSDTSMTGDALVVLCATLALNRPLMERMQHFSLQGSKFTAASNDELRNLFTQCPVPMLRRLNLGDCSGLNFVTLSSCLASFTSVQCLNLQGCRMGKAEKADLQLAQKALLSWLRRHTALVELVLSHSEVGKALAFEVLHEVMTNTALASTRIRLAGCLPSRKTPSDAMSRNVNIDLLDFSKAGWRNDKQIIAFFQALILAPKLTLDTLILRSAFTGKRKPQAVARLCHAISGSLNSPMLRVLDISHQDKQGRALIPELLNNLTGSSGLMELNVSHNKLGDAGALPLAAFLRRTRALRVLFADNNGFDVNGWETLASAVIRDNTCLQYMPSPWPEFAKLFAALDDTTSLKFRSRMDQMQAKVALNRHSGVHPRFRGFEGYLGNGRFISDWVEFEPPREGVPLAGVATAVVAGHGTDEGLLHAVADDFVLMGQDTMYEEDDGDGGGMGHGDVTAADQRVEPSAHGDGVDGLQPTDLATWDVGTSPAAAAQTATPTIPIRHDDDEALMWCNDAPVNPATVPQGGNMLLDFSSEQSPADPEQALEAFFQLQDE